MNENTRNLQNEIRKLNLYQVPVEDWRSRLAKERKTRPMSQQEFVLANTDCGVDGKEDFDVDKARCAGEPEFLGVIGAWGQKSNPVYTATEIENFAKCPFAYMVDKVWGRAPGLPAGRPCTQSDARCRGPAV